jgi:hypothetical protein
MGPTIYIYIEKKREKTNQNSLLNRFLGFGAQRDG